MANSLVYILTGAALIAGGMWGIECTEPGFTKEILTNTAETFRYLPRDMFSSDDYISARWAFTLGRLGGNLALEKAACAFSLAGGTLLTAIGIGYKIKNG